MTDVAGFHVEEVGSGKGHHSPVVLLHGSGQDETFLAALGRAVAPDRPLLCVRGRVPWEGGFAFFRRNPDRTLDTADMQQQCIAFCSLLAALHGRFGRQPILLGFSNGAIMAAASILREPGLTAAAVLLRPLSPAARSDFPPLPGYPVLLVGGEADTRRYPTDLPELACQFRHAGARTDTYVLPAGHGPTKLDENVVRPWLAALR